MEQFVGIDEIFHDWSIAEFRYELGVFEQVVWLGERGHWEPGTMTELEEPGESDGNRQPSDQLA